MSFEMGTFLGDNARRVDEAPASLPELARAQRVDHLAGQLEGLIAAGHGGVLGDTQQGVAENRGVRAAVGLWVAELRQVVRVAGLGQVTPVAARGREEGVAFSVVTHELVTDRGEDLVRVLHPQGIAVVLVPAEHAAKQAPDQGHVGLPGKPWIDPRPILRRRRVEDAVIPALGQHAKHQAAFFVESLRAAAGQAHLGQGFHGLGNVHVGDLDLHACGIGIVKSHHIHRILQIGLEHLGMAVEGQGAAFGEIQRVGHGRFVSVARRFTGQQTVCDPGLLCLHVLSERVIRRRPRFVSGFFDHGYFLVFVDGMSPCRGSITSR